MAANSRHGRRPYLVLSVLHDLVISFLVLFSGLLQLDSIDLDAEELSCEAIIEAEDVAVLYLATLNMDAF